MQIVRLGLLRAFTASARSVGAVILILVLLFLILVVVLIVVRRRVGDVVG